MSGCGDAPDEHVDDPVGGASERTGLVVIRVWLEERDSERGLRARISLVRDVERGEAESVIAASAEEILAAVRRFVDEFVAAR
jgi:hypothetical protein